MAKQTAGTLVFVALLVGTAVGAAVTLGAVGPGAPGTAGPDQQPDATPTDTDAEPTTDLSADGANVAQFSNQSAFEAYVAAGQQLGDASLHAPVSAGGDGAVSTPMPQPTAVPERAVTADTAEAGGDGGTAGPDRIAETNVQVELLDEPDIVKTDGRHFYYAPERQRYYYEPEPVDRRRSGDTAVSDHWEPPKKDRQPKTHVIDASDPDAPAVVSNINTTGKLLQTGDQLVVFEDDRIAGYDVSDAENPTEAWSKPLNGTLVTAREQNGTVYVVTESRVGYDGTCPVEPLGGDHAIACTDIYRPGTQISVDATYSAFSIDAADGTVRDSVSFVGTADNTVVYMSPDALYVTYTQSTDRGALVADFLTEEFDRTPDDVKERIEEIRSYDISTTSQLREMRRALNNWFQTLDAEERRDVQESFRDELDDYVATHQRNLTQTGIVRVGVDDGELAVDSTGVVPGEPLNQFSMSEYNGSLRIATTIPAAGSADSENDLYTLEASSLDRQGAVTGMGETERVYSVRYVDDTAYVVTFRRVDPFHVVDLSNPDNPELKGELKLPGYSSYLHPVDDDTILGIGEEDGKVKTVLFDVSDPADPTIEESRVLDRYYSEVADTHHAFLMDRKHGVFVLPAGSESVVMNYTDLSVEATIETQSSASRARYVEDSLYVFAGQSVTVVDETTWETQTTLELAE